MEKLEKYREAIKNVISEYGQYKLAYGDARNELIFDPVGDHYLFFRVGWNDKKRIYGCIIHIDIIDEKIWIQYNGTEVGLAEELLALGVPKQDIVLGYHSPYMRQFTEFAVN
ncbi:MAG: XisI protein [Cyanobacteriota bacterium]|nr:XisI protein [Cyanobacteriota bacterium]